MMCCKAAPSSVGCADAFSPGRRRGGLLFPFAIQPAWVVGGGGVGGTHRSRPTKCDETVCPSTGPWRWALPGSGRRVVGPYGGAAFFHRFCVVAPSSVTAGGRATSCPRCGIRFPGPLGHGNRAAALLCPRFIRRRRRFGHSPPRGRRGGLLFPGSIQPGVTGIVAGVAGDS